MWIAFPCKYCLRLSRPLSRLVANLLEAIKGVTKEGKKAVLIPTMLLSIFLVIQRARAIIVHRRKNEILGETYVYTVLHYIKEWCNSPASDHQKWSSVVIPSSNGMKRFATRFKCFSVILSARSFFGIANVEGSKSSRPTHTLSTISRSTRFESYSVWSSISTERAWMSSRTWIGRAVFVIQLEARMPNCISYFGRARIRDTASK